MLDFFHSISNGITIIVDYFVNLAEMTVALIKVLNTVPTFASYFFTFFPAVISSVFLIVIAAAVVKAIFGR